MPPVERAVDKIMRQAEAQKTRAELEAAFEVARRASDLQREKDRADDLHARERGTVVRRLTRRERRRMRSGLDLPKSGKFLWRIVDYEALPLDRLKPWIDPHAVEKAIETAIAMGLREIAGVQIVEDYNLGGWDDRSKKYRRRPATADHGRGRGAFHVAYDRRADPGDLTRSELGASGGRPANYDRSRFSPFDPFGDRCDGVDGDPQS